MRLLHHNLALFSAIDTCLKALHVERKAKMVNFAGYNLPASYPQGATKEHLHCFQGASIFDVSHMGQLLVTGKDCFKLLERATTSSTQRLETEELSQCYLSLFLNQQAGILDDAIITASKRQQMVRIVANGANKVMVESNLRQIAKVQQYEVKIESQGRKGLIALQGPKSAQVFQKQLSNIDLKTVPFMAQFTQHIEGSEFIITRSGYTGKDGFQISADSEPINFFTKKLLQSQEVQLAGLAARDSLRLEAGLCLHGNDISLTTTPLEANLMWTVYKPKQTASRLQFIGQKVLRQLQQKMKSKEKFIRKRVGFEVESKSIVRSGAQIFTQAQKLVGTVTSGTHSPFLKKNIGMAFIDSSVAQEQKLLFADCRGKKVPIIIKKMPFVEAQYYKNWKTLYPHLRPK